MAWLLQHRIYVTAQRTSRLSKSDYYVGRQLEFCQLILKLSSAVCASGRSLVETGWNPKLKLNESRLFCFLLGLLFQLMFFMSDEKHFASPCPNVKKIKNLQHKFLFLLVRDCWLSPFSISITLFLFFQPISSVSLVCLSKRFLQKHFAIQVFIFVTSTAGPKKTFIPQEPMYTRSLLTWFGLLRSTNRCGIYSPRLEYLSDCTLRDGWRTRP